MPKKATWILLILRVAACKQPLWFRGDTHFWEWRHAVIESMTHGHIGGLNDRTVSLSQERRCWWTTSLAPDGNLGQVWASVSEQVRNCCVCSRAEQGAETWLCPRACAAEPGAAAVRQKTLTEMEQRKNRDFCSQMNSHNSISTEAHTFGYGPHYICEGLHVRSTTSHHVHFHLNTLVSEKPDLNSCS